MTEKKIRATLGDSVIVGVERGRGGNNSQPYITIQVREDGENVDIWLNDGWNVEYIQELPTLPGAIVRNNDTLFVRMRHAGEFNNNGAQMWIELDANNPFVVWGDDIVSEGGFEVLFEGVA